MGTWLALAVALAVAVGVARWAEALAVPVTVALLLLGVGLGAWFPGLAGLLTPGLILKVALPVLVFEAACLLEADPLREAGLAIGWLAVPGVAVTVAIVAAATSAFGHLPLASALVFGAIVAATDPVGVVATFRRLGLPARLTAIVEGESLYNDGTGIAAFQVVMACHAAPQAVSPLDAAGHFLWISGGAMVLGFPAGWLAARLPARGPARAIAQSLALAYGTYLLADALGLSGVIAVVSAAISWATAARRRGREALDVPVARFWTALAAGLSGLLFLLIGASVRPDTMVPYLPEIGWGLAATLLARAVVVYGSAPLLGRLGVVLPWRWRHLLFAGGIRGAVAVALVLSLPAGFADRPRLIAMTFALVLVTVVGFGIGVIPLARREAPPEGRPTRTR